MDEVNTNIKDQTVFYVLVVFASCLLVVNHVCLIPLDSRFIFPLLMVVENMRSVLANSFLVKYIPFHV